MRERTRRRDQALEKQIRLWDCDDTLLQSGWHRTLSERHRTWGPQLAAIDTDMVFTEFVNFQPVCVVEFKHCASSHVCFEDNYQVRAVRAMADAMSRPAFLVVYQELPVWVFRAWPINNRARLLVGDEGKWFHERSYVRWMFELRGYAMTTALEQHINQFSEATRDQIDERLMSWRPIPPRSVA